MKNHWLRLQKEFKKLLEITPQQLKSAESDIAAYVERYEGVSVDFGELPIARIVFTPSKVIGPGDQLKLTYTLTI